MSLIDWVNTRRPLWNLLITAVVLHGGLTFLCGLAGLAWYAVFGFVMKEGEPLALWALRGFKPERSPYRPGRSEQERGWTVEWKVADSLADVLAPFVVALLL